MFVSHGQQPGEEDSIWCLLLTFCQQYYQTVHVDAKTRDGLLTQEQKYHSLNWLTKLTKPITATEQTYPSYSYFFVQYVKKEYIPTTLRCALVISIFIFLVRSLTSWSLIPL